MSGGTAAETASGAVFALDQVQAMVPIDTSTWLGVPDNLGATPAEAVSLVDCDSLSTWLGVPLPVVDGYTRSCGFYQPSFPSPAGQTVTVLPPRHTGSGSTRPEDRFTAQVFYAPPGVDARTTPSDLSYQRGLLNVWIHDVTAESGTPQQPQALDSEPLDSAQGGHVSGTLHGRPASVQRTFGDRISVTTVLPVGSDALSFDMASELTPMSAVAAAVKVLPS